MIQSLSRLQALVDLGFTENARPVNLKLLWMFLACAVGAATQFWPNAFPKYRWLLATGAISYFALSIWLQVHAWLIEKNTILETMPAELPASAPAAAKSDASAAKKVVQVPQLLIRTTLGRFEDQYILQIVEKSSEKVVAEMKKSYGCYFTADRGFAQSLLRADVAEISSKVVNILGAAQSKKTN